MTIHGQQVEGAAVQILMAGMIDNDRVLCVFALRIKLAQAVLNRGVILVGFGQPDLNQMVLVIDDNVQIKSRSLIVPYPLAVVAMHDRVILYVTDIDRICKTERPVGEDMMAAPAIMVERLFVGMVCPQAA